MNVFIVFVIFNLTSFLVFPFRIIGKDFMTSYNIYSVVELLQLFSY